MLCKYFHLVVVFCWHLFWLYHLQCCWGQPLGNIIPVGLWVCSVNAQKHAAELDSPPVRFSWCAAQNIAGRALQRPSRLDHLRSLAWPFAYVFGSPTLRTGCGTSLKDVSAKVACFWQMMARVPKSQYYQCCAFTENVWGHFKCLSALSKLGLCVIHSLNECPCEWLPR